jgi:peptide/nickel transport system substrate-binding protein
MYRRRPLLRFTVGITSAVLIGSSLAACSFKSSSGSTGGGLTIAIQSDIREPDNILASISVDKLIMGSTVYDPLFTSDKAGNPQPALATKATASPDFKTWTVALRTGVKFTDGKTFTAKDVKENFDAFQNPKNASDFAGDLDNLASTDVVDDNTVRFNLKLPDAHFPSIIEDTMYIGDLDHRTSGPLLKPGEVPVGTGPYKWSARAPGSSLTFVPNASYWRGKPPLSKVTFKVIPDAQVAALAVQSGEVDLVTNYIAPQSIPALQKDKKLQIASEPGNTIYQAYFNFEKARRGGYKNSDDVHLGLAYLMDTADIVPKLIGQFGTLANQPVPSWQAGNDPNLQAYPYDPQKGMQLLAEGGIPKGGNINLLVFVRPYMCEWATAVQSNLKSLGYKVSLQCLQPEVAPATITKYKWDVLFARTSGRPTASSMYSERWSLAASTPSDDFYTLRDPQLQQIIDQMNATADTAKYSALGAQAADRIIKTDVAEVGGYFDKAYVVASTRVKGLVLSPIVWYGILYNAMTKVTVTGSSGSS